MELMKRTDFVAGCFMACPEWILHIGRADIVFVMIWESDPASATCSFSSAMVDYFSGWGRYTWFKLEPVVKDALEDFIIVKHVFVSIARVIQ